MKVKSLEDPLKARSGLRDHKGDQTMGASQMERLPYKAAYLSCHIIKLHQRMSQCQGSLVGSLIYNGSLCGASLCVGKKR